MMFFNKKTKEMLRDDFYTNLIKLNYIQDKKIINKLINQNKKIANKLPELKGWPNNPVKFWNAESYGWDQKINNKIRDKIKKELKNLKGKNLDLGSGSYTYVKNSISLDFSKEMLKQNKNKNKILYKIRDKLPFKDNEFDSVTMIFILNYLEHPKEIIKQVKRILKPNGILAIIQPKNFTDEFYKFQVKHHYNEQELNELLKDFKISIKELNIENKKLILIKAK